MLKQVSSVMNINSERPVSLMNGNISQFYNPVRYGKNVNTDKRYKSNIFFN